MADDDEDDCLLVESAFQEIGIAHDLRFVDDGRELLDYLYNEGDFADPEKHPRPDLILLDLNMPLIDGREALTTIKSDPQLKNMPILIFTTSKQSRVLFHALVPLRIVHDREKLMNNAERAEVSNQAGASLFLRLHCDAGPNHGFTLYFPDRKGTDRGFTGPSDEVLLESRGAAYKMHAGMLPILRGYLKDRGVKGESRTKVGRMQGALTGSILSKAPVVTVEMVFLNNKYDAGFIKSAAGQDRMARSLANGVIDYLQWKDSHKILNCELKISLPGCRKRSFLLSS